MRKDIDLMMFFADYMNEHNHKIKGINPKLIVGEFKRWTEQELDFIREASNIEIFRNNFMKNKNIIIPKLYEKYSTKKILTMDFIDGVELNDIKKVKERKYNINKLVKIGLDSILKQVFIDGFFHADPHPRNIIIVSDDEICFVDFGIVGVFDEKMRDEATNIFCGIVKNDVEMVMDGLLDMGMEGDNIDMLKIEIENKIKFLQNVELKDIIISEVLEDLLSTLQKHGFRIPIDFVLFGKTLMTLEGLALKYDPGFRISVQSKIFVKKIIKRRRSPEEVFKRLVDTTIKLKDFTVRIPEKTAILLKRVKDANINLKYIDRDLRCLVMEMDKSSNRITFGLIITALIIASTITLGYDEITIMDISAFSFIGYLISAFLILLIIISMIREKRY